MKSIILLHVCTGILSLLLFLTTPMEPILWVFYLGIIATIGAGTFLVFNKSKQQHEALTSQEILVENIKNITKRKEIFISKISHDLRTPLHGINGLIELLEKEQLSDSGQSYLQKLRIGSSALLEVISGVIELNRPEDSDIEVNNAPLELSKLSEELIQLYSTNCYLKNIQLSLFIEPAIYGKTYLLDKNKLNQILTNLLSNAIKFTDSGEVTLWIKETILYEGTSKITFMVTDNGIGIPEEDIPFLTQPYYQVSSMQKNRIKGTGLGLNICLSLLKSMHSKLIINSEEGIGSQFSFSLEADSATKLHTPNHKIKENKNIVLLSKKSVTTENILNYLEFWNIESRFIESHEIESIQTNIDLLIIQGFSEAELNILIPKLLTIELKLIYVLIDAKSTIIEQKFNNTHLYYHYGYFSPGSLHRLLIESDVLVKSNHNTLPKINYLKLLKELIKEQDTCMLVVDDNEINQLVLTEMLYEAGVNKVEVANNGLEAVNLSTDNDYDLIWMDLMMPIMDGFTATKKILEQKPKTTICGLSAATDPEIIGKSGRYGMTELLGKPLNKNDLHIYLLNYYEHLKHPSNPKNTLNLARIFKKEGPLKVLIHSIDNQTLYKLKQYFDQQQDVYTTYFYAPDSIIYHCQIEAFDLIFVDINDSQLAISAFMHEYTLKRQKMPIILVNAVQKIYIHKSNEIIRCLPINFNAQDVEQIFEYFKEDNAVQFQNKPTLSEKDRGHEL